MISDYYSLHIIRNSLSYHRLNLNLCNSIPSNIEFPDRIYLKSIKEMIANCANCGLIKEMMIHHINWTSNWLCADLPQGGRVGWPGGCICCVETEAPVAVEGKSKLMTALVHRPTGGCVRQDLPQAEFKHWHISRHPLPFNNTRVRTSTYSIDTLLPMGSPS
jgi:hypothetical protein